MWIKKPKYPVRDPLPEIVDHRSLPRGAVEIAKIRDTNGEGDLWVFVKNNNGLSILDTYSKTLKDGTTRYGCYQKDFPLKFLNWFEDALTRFQRPPAKGGLHSGAMTSADEDVDGEMLCIQRAMGAGGGQGGYAVVNRSRCKKGKDISTKFTPHEVSWADSFIFEGGLLDLIKKLAKKYDCGSL